MLWWTRSFPTGGAAIWVAAEVTDLDAIERIRLRAEEELGPVEVPAAFAASGGPLPGPTAQITEEGWRSAIDGNLTSTFLTLKSFLPGMVERGRLLLLEAVRGDLAALAVEDEGVRGVPALDGVEPLVDLPPQALLAEVAALSPPRRRRRPAPLRARRGRERPAPSRRRARPGTRGNALGATRQEQDPAQVFPYEWDGQPLRPSNTRDLRGPGWA